MNAMEQYFHPPGIIATMVLRCKAGIINKDYLAQKDALTQP